MIKVLLYILPFISVAQQPFNLTADVFRILVEENHGLGIGNACNEHLMPVEVFGDLNMNGNPIEVLKSHIVIYGEIINPGPIVYLCNDSILELQGETLTVAEQPVQELRIWPVPATSEINISGIEVTRLQLYDLTGRKLKDYTTFGRLHRIVVEDLAPGVYILVVNENITKRIVKQ